MSDRASNVDRVSELTGAICDQSASQNDFAELDSTMRADPRSRYQYLDYCRLHVALRLELRAHRATQKLHQQIDIESVVPALSESNAAQRETSSAVPLGILATTFHGTVGYLSSDWSVAYLIATVILGIALVIGSLVPVSQPAQIARQSPVPSRGDAEPKMEPVGRITGMVDCKWEEGAGDGGPGTGAENQKSEIRNQKSLVTLGDKFALASGLMEITYDTGAKVILQGPVAYEVEAPTGGFLSVGKLTARMEKKVATGHWPLFTVRTPTATVTDLGTEFGVTVSREGGTEAHVFVGAIKMARAGGRSGSEIEQIVRAGSAARFDSKSGRITVTELNERQFVRVLSVKTPASRAEGYARLVLSLKPVLYYRMEQPKDEKDRHVVFDSAPGTHHGELHLPNEFYQPWLFGRFGDSLHLSGPTAPGYVIVPDYPIAKNDRLSVSVWVLAEGRPRGAKIAGNWPAYQRGQFHLGLDWKDDHDLVIGVAQRDGREIVLREGASKPFPVGHWQHVAFVVDKSVLRLYRNGAEVASTPCNGLLTHPYVSTLSIGCQTDDSGRVPHDNYLWQGRIDELAVFHSALSADDIGRLSGHGPPEGHTSR